MFMLHAAELTDAQSFAVFSELRVAFLFRFAALQTFRGSSMGIRHREVIQDIFLRFGGVAGEGDGEEAFLGDWLLRRFADAVGAVVHAFDGWNADISNKS